MRKKELKVMNSWPRFASYEGDAALRSDKWSSFCGDRRCIFWDNTNISGSVATFRSGNERHVNMSKRAGLFKRELLSSMNPSVVADAWLCWGFRVNFMYQSPM